MDDAKISQVPPEACRFIPVFLWSALGCPTIGRQPLKWKMLRYLKFLHLPRKEMETANEMDTANEWCSSSAQVEGDAW